MSDAVDKFTWEQCLEGHHRTLDWLTEGIILIGEAEAADALTPEVLVAFYSAIAENAQMGVAVLRTAE